MTTLLLLALASCGTERWAVKTASDDEARNIVHVARPATVDELVRLPAPAYDDNAPRHSEELRVYRVRGRIVEAKLEADGDYHVVLQSMTTRATMIIELPAPGCVETSFMKADILIARRVAERLLGRLTPKMKRLPKPLPVDVEGVLFFDKPHGQAGLAPNGAELHPVRRIKGLADTSVSP